MKKYFFLLLIMALFIVSCNETIDPYKEDNSTPVINFMSPYPGKIGDFNTDSVKLGFTYDFQVDIQDEQSNLYLDVMVSNEIFTLKRDGNKFTITASQVGETDIVLSVKDCYGSTATQSFKLVCFSNLPPVCRAQCDIIAILHPLERKINALSSFDRDQKYGGKITAYEFTITGNKTVINDDGYMMYIFPSPGAYRVKIRVKDSDNAWSDDYYLNISVN